MDSITTQMNGALHMRQLVRTLHDKMFFINGSAIIPEDKDVIQLRYVLENGDSEEVEYDLNCDGYTAAENDAIKRAKTWRLRGQELFEQIEKDIKFQGFVTIYNDFYFKIERSDEEYKFPYSVTGYAQCKNIIEC